MKRKSIHNSLRDLLMRQAVFGETVNKRLTGIIKLSSYQEPEIGFLIEKILEEEK